MANENSARDVVFTSRKKRIFFCGFALISAIYPNLVSAQNAYYAEIGESSRDQETNRGISIELRQRIEVFLARRILQEKIGADLLPIIMDHLDAEATGRSLPEKKRLYPAFKSYPSVAQQVRWQRSLNLIASEFSSAFPPNVIPLPESVETPPKPGEVIVPSTDHILWRIPAMISGSQGAFSEALQSNPTSAIFEGDGTARQGFAKWAVPFRISATGHAALDQRVQDEIASILSERLSRVTAVEFSGSTEEGNVKLPTSMLPLGSVDFVALCLGNPECVTLRDLSLRTSSEKPFAAEKRQLFFERLYLTNPYGARSAASALLELDAEGRPTQGFCGPMDIGHFSSEPRQSLAKSRLGYCLRELLSPGSGGQADLKQFSAATGE